MSEDSTQNIPQEATKLRKLSKVTVRYMEMEQFKDSDHHTGDGGPDVYGKSSGEIARHGICSLWEPNEKEMR